MLKTYSSIDAGYGCTVRALQTALLHALSLKDPSTFTCTALSSLFADDGPLGLLAILSHSPGERARWRGPAEVAFLIAWAAARANLPVVAQGDATIVESEVFSSATATAILLLPVRLNEAAELTPSSARDLEAVLCVPGVVGVVAGVRGHSHFLPAGLPQERGRFRALDPGRVQESGASLIPRPSDWRTLSTDSLASSVCFVFLVSRDDFAAFRAALPFALPSVAFARERVGVDDLSAPPSPSSLDAPDVDDWTDACATPTTPTSNAPRPKSADWLARTAHNAARLWGRVARALRRLREQ